MAKPTLYSQEMIEQYRSRGYWDTVTYADIWNQRAMDCPDKEAVVDARTRITWAEAKRWTDRIALGLLERGFKKDEMLVVQLPNWAELILFRIACEKAGVLCLPAPWALRHKEMAYILQKVHAAGIVIPWEYHGFNHVEMVGKIRPGLAGLKHIFVLGDNIPPGSVSVEEMAKRPIEEKYPAGYLEQTRYGAQEYSGVRLTTGSAGFPKFVETPICGLVYYARMYAQACRLSADDICGNFVPAPTGPNVLSNMSAPLVGAKIVMLERFKANDALRLIEKERITIVGVVPTMLSLMIDDPDFETYDLGSLRAVLVTGAPLPPSLAVKAEEKIGPIVPYYGTVDFGGITAPFVDAPREVRLFTVNRIVAGTQVKLLDGQGSETAPGEIGELTVKGPTCNSGFHQDPEATWQIWSKDGWFRSGDLARFDKEGNLVIVGRVKDVIIRGGQNILPGEVEKLLLEHPKVADVTIVGMPDAVMGERACAYVVPGKGQHFSFDEMVNFLREKNIAAYKLPERLEIVDQFPLLPGSPKVDKKLLVRDIINKLSTEKKGLL
ncbi:MAG: AMP-binding protein [Desulfobacterales bacterium]|nr:AMP-binding protein [Desulfobacterales bacterium]